MKKIVIIVTLLAAPLLSYAQSLFDKYEDLDGVSSVVINQKMFSMLANIDVQTDDPEAQEFVDMVNNLKSMKIIVTGNEKVSANIKADVTKYIGNSKLEELMRVKDDGKNVKFYVREGKDENHVKELLMFVSGLKEFTKDQDITINGEKRELETVLLSLTGDIDLRKVSKLTDKMDIPGGKHLKKTNDRKK